MDQPGESETEWAIRLGHGQTWNTGGIQANPAVSTPCVLISSAVYAERIAAAKAAGARQERKASQRIITVLAALFTVSLIGNLIQLVTR